MRRDVQQTHAPNQARRTGADRVTSDETSLNQAAEKFGIIGVDDPYVTLTSLQLVHAQHTRHVVDEQVERGDHDAARVLSIRGFGPLRMRRSTVVRELITATERLGWPKRRWTGRRWIRWLWPVEVQGRLVHEDQAETTATCHLQVAEDRPALCGDVNPNWPRRDGGSWPHLES